MTQAKNLLQEVFGVVMNHRVQDKVAKVSMFLWLVVIKTNEVLNVVMGSNVLDILENEQFVSQQ